jgi:hypothetical protein
MVAGVMRRRGFDAAVFGEDVAGFVWPRGRCACDLWVVTVGVYRCRGRLCVGAA